MRIQLIPHKGELLLVFEEAYKWLSFSPAEARDVATKMIAFADQVEAETKSEKKVMQ